MYYKQYIILKQICQQIFHKMYELTLFDGICVKPRPQLLRRLFRPLGPPGFQACTISVSGIPAASLLTLFFNPARLNKRA